MKSLVFDTGPVITLAMNNLLWTLEFLKTRFEGRFYIPDSVKFELIDKPLESKKYKLEAIMVDNLISTGSLEVYSKLDVDHLMEHVNNIFISNNKPIYILDRAEVEALALALRLQSGAYVVDERTMRLLIEDPKSLKRILEKKVHSPIDVNEKLLKDFQYMTKGWKVVRSCDLMVLAYELGLFNKYINKVHNDKTFLDGLLWGLRLRGCGISEDEIEKIIGYEIKRNR